MSLFNVFKSPEYKSEPKSYIENIDRKIMPYVEYEGYEDLYPTKNFMSMGSAFYDELRQASGDLYKIFEKTMKVFQNCPSKFMTDMEIPEKIQPYLNIPNALDLPTWISRFDFVVDTFGKLKLVELNADTPCAIVEAYYGNGIAADFFDRKDPNAGEYDKLVSFLNKINRKFDLTVNRSDSYYSKSKAIFSCFHDYPEDFANTKFLMDAFAKTGASALEGPEFISFYDLSVNKDRGIVLPDGSDARLFYRLHPMELLVDEVNEAGAELGLIMLEAYKKGLFGMINPPEAIVMQSKGFQALVWAIYKFNDDFFTDAEKATIAKYMIPSFTEDDFEQAKLDDPAYFYFKKPIWGREGKGISIIAPDKIVYESKTIECPDEIVHRESKGFLYQQCVEAKKFRTISNLDTFDAYNTVSCFMLGDQPSAVYARLSPERIAGTEAYWSPLL